MKIERAEFEALAQACRFDPLFPPTFEEWQALVARGLEFALDEGRSVSELRLDVQDFVAWCARVEIQPGLDALRACCILARRRSKFG